MKKYLLDALTTTTILIGLSVFIWTDLTDCDSFSKKQNTVTASELMKNINPHIQKRNVVW